MDLPTSRAFHSDLEEAFRLEQSIPQAIRTTQVLANAFSFGAVKRFLPASAKLPFSFSATQLPMEILPPASVKLSFSLAMRMATAIPLRERAKFFSLAMLLASATFLRRYS